MKAGPTQEGMIQSWVIEFAADSKQFTISGIHKGEKSKLPTAN